MTELELVQKERIECLKEVISIKDSTIEQLRKDLQFANTLLNATRYPISYSKLPKAYGCIVED